MHFHDKVCVLLSTRHAIIIIIITIYARGAEQKLQTCDFSFCCYPLKWFQEYYFSTSNGTECGF